MKYKLVCADIDGTLVNDQKEIPDQVKRSLEKAVEQGARIVLASGRMPAGVEDIEKKLGIECIKICNAGTYIIMDEKCISAEYLPPNALMEVYQKVAKKYQIPLWIFRDREWFVTGTDKFIEREKEIVPYVPLLVDAQQLAGQWNKEKKAPNKLFVAADEERIPEIYQGIKAQGWTDMDIACSSDTFIEIFPKGVNKGKALSVICQELGISLEDTIAFGDHELDISIIEKAGVGIAMGNAIDALKQKADFVTKSNNEAGVAYALEHYLTI